jgi:cysteine synthase
MTPVTLSPQRNAHQPSPLFANVTESLGLVPIVRVNQINARCQQHDLYLKLESCNPGGSIKEKNAAYLVTDAEQRGLLKPGGTIVESSSGNFGIGLAIVGAVRGYRVKIVIDAKTSPTIRRMLTAYGADLIEIPLSKADAHGSMQIARMKMAQKLTRGISGAWYPCQHLNPQNIHAHALFTAREIEASFNGALDTLGQAPLTGIAIGVSTAGQLGGIAGYFKDRYPQIKIIGIDVAGSVVFGTPQHAYKMTGLGLSFVPPNFDPDSLDAAYTIDDRLAFSVCHTLARKEGLLLGASTGAIVAGTLAYVSHCQSPQRVLMINPDRGDRYLETIYNTEWLEQQQISLWQEPELSQVIESLQPVAFDVLHSIGAVT